MNARTFLLVGVVLSGFCGAGVLEAKIDVKSDFEGTLMITSPEGKVTMVDAGSPVPDIALQSSLEVFQGLMLVNLAEGDQAAVGCLGKTGTISGPASVQIQCGEKTGTVKSIKGTVNFDDLKVVTGETKTLILGGTQVAAATAEGNEIGAGTDLGIPAVDSRSLESSPSQ